MTPEQRQKMTDLILEKRKNRNRLKQFVKASKGGKSGVYTRSRKHDAPYSPLARPQAKKED